MQHGDNLKMYEQRIEDGLPVPAMDSRPKLKESLLFYYEAFNFLASRRQYGMGANPIPTSEMESYLRVYPWYDPHLFLRYISSLDNAYLKEKARVDELKSKSNQKK